MAELIQEVLGKRVERGFLMNLDNNERGEFLFNPRQLEEIYEVKYSRAEVPGLSYEPMHFTGLKNTQIPLTLYFDEVVAQERKGPTAAARQLVREREMRRRRVIEAIKGPGGPVNDVDRYRRFLMSLATPRKTQRLGAASPPPVLFYWPEMITMRVRITRLHFTHQVFEVGTPRTRIYTVQVSLEEDALERIYSEDRMRYGAQRPWATASMPRRG